MLQFVRDKAIILSDFKHLLEFLFIEQFSFHKNDQEILVSDLGIKILEAFLFEIEQKHSLKNIAHNIQNTTKCTAKEFWHVIRIALTGEAHGPSLEMIISIYGLSKVKERINYVLASKNN